MEDVLIKRAEAQYIWPETLSRSDPDELWVQMPPFSYHGSLVLYQCDHQTAGGETFEEGLFEHLVYKVQYVSLSNAALIKTF